MSQSLYKKIAARKQVIQKNVPNTEKPSAEKQESERPLQIDTNSANSFTQPIEIPPHYQKIMQVRSTTNKTSSQARQHLAPVSSNLATPQATLRPVRAITGIQTASTKSEMPFSGIHFSDFDETKRVKDEPLLPNQSESALINNLGSTHTWSKPRVNTSANGKSSSVTRGVVNSLKTSEGHSIAGFGIN